jgi:hypothetical protein
MKTHILLQSFLAGSALLLATQTPSSANTSFDGNWSVLATTTGGKCDPYLGYRLVIMDGRVFSREARGVSGWVTGAGRVAVTMRGTGSTITGVGRLARGAGSGRWTAQSPSGPCVGEWRAKLRA